MSKKEDIKIQKMVQDNLIKKEYQDMTEQSWTYEKMTEEERKRWRKALEHAHLRGTRQQRWEIMNDCYFSFLEALEYEPFGWRENKAI